LNLDIARLANKRKGRAGYFFAEGFSNAENITSKMQDARYRRKSMLSY